MKDPHSILGVEKSATLEEIKKAYRKMAKEHHPDKGGDEDKFKEAAEAYDLLTNPKAKSSSPFGSSHGEFDFGDLFARFSGGNPGNWREEFDAKYGGNNRKGRNTTYNMIIPIEDAYFGSTKGMNIGLRLVDVKIPAGVVNGQKLRIKGYGQRGATEDLNGDLILEILIQENESFYLDNIGLHTLQSIDVFDAILGAEVHIKIFDKSIKYTIPEGTQNGATLRLKGKGWPIMNKPKEQGDLYLTVVVKIPTELSIEEKTSLKKVKEHIDGREGQE